MENYQKRVRMPYKGYKTVGIKKTILYGTFSLFISALCSCANMVAPGGGEKDVKPPDAISFDPPNFSTSFSSRQIRINFDELVELRDPTTQVIISPDIFPKPVFKVRKKNLLIDLPDTLQANTTYSITFGSAVRDITEGNIAELRYVFSTGPFIDSLKLEGRVINAATLSPEKNITILLYDTQTPDSLIFKQNPVAITKSAENGNFSLSNLKSGSYKLYGLNDLNNNRLLDKKDEGTGFSDSLIQLDSSRNNLVLKVFPHKGEGKITGSSWKENIMIITDKTLESPSVRIINVSDPVYTEFKEDTIRIWPSAEFLKDTLSIEVSEQGKPLDTARIFSSAKTKVPLTIGSTGAVLIPENPFKIILNNPLKEWQADSIYLLEDSIPVKAEITLEGARTILVNYAFKEGKNYLLTIPQDAVTDMYGNKSKLFRQLFLLADPEKYASLNLRIDAEEGNYIAELINSANTVVRRDMFTGTADIAYTFIKPDRYRIRIILDENKNQRWDTGDIVQKKQPEKLFYHPEELTLRANWDLETVITLRKKDFQ